MGGHQYLQSGISRHEVVLNAHYWTPRGILWAFDAHYCQRGEQQALISPDTNEDVDTLLPTDAYGGSGHVRTPPPHRKTIVKKNATM